MKKDLSRDAVVAAAAKLMSAGGPAAVSFRAVARELCCAHTNLYNYFADPPALVAECGGVVLAAMKRVCLSDLSATGDRRAILGRFYGNAVRFYLQHPGWFQLLWSYPAPRAALARAKTSVASLVGEMVEAVRPHLGCGDSAERAFDVLHTVHAYLHGELAMFFAGRSLFKRRQELESYVVERCVLLTLALADAARGQGATPARRRHS